MLVLSRCVGEKIILRDKTDGTRICLTAVRIAQGRVRIGVDADKDRYEIVREEVPFEQPQTMNP